MASRATHNMHGHGHLHKRTFHAHAIPRTSAVVNEIASLVRRAPAAAQTCGTSHSADCTTPAQDENNQNITIAVATAVPITIAIIVLIFLHRRIKYRMRREDLNDKHKSLDFGLDDVGAPQSKKGGRSYPEMAINGARSTRDRGLSMDMHLASPYLLPEGIGGSRDSLGSLSRTHHDVHDPYRPVHMTMSKEKLNSRLYSDSGSSRHRFSEKSSDLPRAGLLSHAASPAQGNTPDMLQDRFSPFTDQSPNGEHPLPIPPPPKRTAARPRPADGPGRWYPSDDKRHGSESPPDLSSFTPQTPQDMLSHQPSAPVFQEPLRVPSPPQPEWNEKQYATPAIHVTGDRAQDALRITVPEPTHSRENPLRLPTRQPSPPSNEEATPLPPPPVPEHNGNTLRPQLDQRRVSVMGMRPLPPDDPSDNPEQRANRIRSFYREYFDDSKPNPPGQYPTGYDQYADEEYYGDFLDDGAVYDPETGAFYYSQPAQQHVEPMPRRAMTPPPQSRNAHHLAHRSIMSTQSAGRPMFQPKKRLPPPKALTTLPTPHLLRDDTANVIDFAPRTTFRDRQLGRGPDSPLGTTRPFSPAFRAHTPIASSFDDLAVMPSPHALRKSGTFMALDFAMPPRFRERGETMSETGSIRSNRSGMSALQREAVRAGAYRLSRLPKDSVGTQADFKQSLKPQWDMNR